MNRKHLLIETCNIYTACFRLQNLLLSGHSFLHLYFNLLILLFVCVLHNICILQFSCLKTVCYYWWKCKWRDKNVNLGKRFYFWKTPQNFFITPFLFVPGSIFAVFCLKFVCLVCIKMYIKLVKIALIVEPSIETFTLKRKKKNRQFM